MKAKLDLSDFEACPLYNEWLDEQYTDQSAPLDILGYQPRPSFVLFSLSQDTYQAAFDDFRRQREEELKDKVCNVFPSPIAHYFYRFENGYESDLQRLHLLRDTWEAIVDVIHSIAVAECRFISLPLAESLTFKDVLSDSVAQRLLNVERIITFAQSELIKLRFTDIVPMSAVQTMRDLNQSRNVFSHSATQSELQARAWISECYEDVVSILDDLRGLADVQVLRYVGQVDAETLRCEVFRGHGFTKTFATIALTEKQVRESRRFFHNGHMLVSFSGSILSLQPLIYYFVDGSGHTTKLCMFRKARGDVPNRRLEYEVVGESVRREEDRAMFKPEMDELRALFELTPD